MTKGFDFITNLHAADPQTVAAALTTATQWTTGNDLQAQPKQTHALLTGLIAVVDREKPFEQSLRRDAAALLVKIMGDHYELRESPDFSDIAAWYDDQVNYDDVVLDQVAERSLAAIKTEQAPFLEGLHSGDSERVKKTLAGVQHWIDYHTSGDSAAVYGPIVLALKDILDNDTRLDSSTLADVRALLVREMWFHHRLIGGNSPEIAALLEWYLTTDEYKAEVNKEQK